jgi:molybdopterin-guanine dinucleotide biosynthesis protein A
VIDALVTAGGRLPQDLAKRCGTDIKASAVVGGLTLLARTLAALRGVPAVERIVVVGPDALRDAAGVDEFITERATGEENLLAALRAARGDRTLFCASDMPFVSSHALGDLLARAPEDACAVYPVFTRDEFERAYPKARSSFAVLADGAWTGASAFVVRAQVLLRREHVLTRAFAARKSLPALAALFGPALMFSYLRGALRVSAVEARASRLFGAPVVALRGADPALAADCDDVADFDYAEALFARTAS